MLLKPLLFLSETYSQHLLKYHFLSKYNDESKSIPFKVPSKIDLGAIKDEDSKRRFVKNIFD